MTATVPTVGQIMVTAPRTIDRNASLEMADELVGHSAIRHLPVVDGGQVVGVLSQRDLLPGAVAHALGYGSVSRSRILRTIPVKEVMSEPPVTVESDTPVREAARLMVARKIGCLPVVDGGRLVGLVTETDVVRHAFDV